jgi:hypothetical protein
MEKQRELPKAAQRGMNLDSDPSLLDCLRSDPFLQPLSAPAPSAELEVLEAKEPTPTPP